jgi:hypothetical protein
MQTTCDLCGNPTDGYVCERDTTDTARHLGLVVDLAGEVETNVARLARYATRGVRVAAQPDVEQYDRQPGALRATPLPVDLNASARAAHAFNHVTTWARVVEDDRGVRVPDVRVGEHPAAVAAVFLLAHLDWMRHQRLADEAFEQLRAAGATIQRIVDRPPDQELVGVCDCGRYLYVRPRAAEVRCRCGLAWDVRTSRGTLMETLRDRLVTVAEAATLGVLAFPDLQRERVRKLVASWVRTDRPNHLIGVDMPDPDGRAYQVYPFGEVLDRLSAHVIRVEQRDPAIVSV